jgi:hypothetical protein
MAAAVLITGAEGLAPAIFASRYALRSASAGYTVSNSLAYSSATKRAASGRSESCEKGASGSPPLTEQTSAPGQDQLAVWLRACLWGWISIGGRLWFANRICWFIPLRCFCRRFASISLRCWRRTKAACALLFMRRACSPVRRSCCLILKRGRKISASRC